MDKRLEDFNFKSHGNYDVSLIKNHIKNFFNEWFIDTSRQDNFMVHKDTTSYFIYQSNLLWGVGEEYINKIRTDDKILLELVEPIIKSLEGIHDGVRGNVLLIKLKANHNIPIHSDSGDYLIMSRRHHIPIVTSKQTVFGVGSEKINMGEGECWEINNTRPHLVENNSDIDRVHLLIDIMPNAILGEQ